MLHKQSWFCDKGGDGILILIKVFVCVSVISTHMQIKAQMWLIGFWLEIKFRWVAIAIYGHGRGNLRILMQDVYDMIYRIRAGSSQKVKQKKCCTKIKRGTKNWFSLIGIVRHWPALGIDQGSQDYFNINTMIYCSMHHMRSYPMDQTIQLSTLD